MELKNIIDEVRKNLTGDVTSDIEYINGIAKEHMNDENANQILNELGRIVYELLPEDEKKAFDDAIVQNQDEINQAVVKAQQLLVDKDLAGAKTLMEEVIEKIQEAKLEDDENIYASFHSFFEQSLYKYKFEPQKPIVPAKYDYNTIYTMYGYILIEDKQVLKAITNIEIAKKWNPVALESIFELAEGYKLSNLLDKFYDINIEGLKYASNCTQIAKLYRNLGYYFVEKEDYVSAVCLFTISDSFEKSEMVKTEMEYIEKVTGNKVSKVGVDEVKTVLRGLDIQIGPDADVIGIANAIGDEAVKNNDKATALECYSICYNLTGNDIAKKKLEDLEK